MDCLSTSHQRSSKIKDEGANQKGNKKSLMKRTSKQINQTPPDPNTAALCNISSTERNPKVLAVSSRSRKSSLNTTEKQKQSTLESFIQKNSSVNKNISHLETESSSSPERPRPSLPEMFKKKQTNSKQNLSKKSSPAVECLTENEDVFSKNQPGTPKPVLKLSRQRLTSAAMRSSNPVHNLCNPDVDDGEAFEDFFSPANNSHKQRVTLFGSTSDTVHLPTFDLEDPNKKKSRKSAKFSSTKRKHENIDVNEILLNSTPVNKSEVIITKKPESSPEHLSARSEMKEMPRCEEIKLEPFAKKRKRRTRQSCAISSEEEDGDGSDKPCPANERKGWTDTSLTSSTAVNVKLQKTPEPDTQHGIEKRIGLKSM